jgi:hypothetical protein
MTVVSGIHNYCLTMCHYFCTNLSFVVFQLESKSSSSDVEKTLNKSFSSTKHDELLTKRIAPAPALTSEGEPKKSTRPAGLIPDAYVCTVCKHKRPDHDSLIHHMSIFHAELTLKRSFDDIVDGVFILYDPHQKVSSIHNNVSR